jgi:hypothetical protein
MDALFLNFRFADAGLAEQGRERIAAWSRTFKLVYDQLSAVVEAQEEGVRLIVRLAFGGGEQLSLERWLERIPDEEPFVNGDFRLVQAGDPDYADLQAVFARLTVQ